ncbi:MAG TPA: tryptophan synthase subunit alpha [Gammaproteobacteria bacterium]|jgi:tryptophan synthase alpha chain|nr:tryptophan synthase subunit alpha [Chromatiales bacterium]MCP4926692.1 tryptophan synthase subunit alpha [Gammaproteobacteria bacterium]MDP7094062.1 tryptophan synthase subunit alpha [Gammaproteobacteria bacterium]MDP7295981.1 tryptophan synthase subunit alpha [Gammaproteobacteria bacterium]MDP7660216.1 tryptophan synthase subunit alpha [Gammaproteobacteria bacterium]
MQPHARISAALNAAVAAGRVGLVPYVTAGYPDRNTFVDTLKKIAAVADVIEVGVPFSDPMADGVTIQRSSRIALEQGVSLRWILAELARAGTVGAPVVLMSYLNPLLVYGYEALATDCVKAGVCGFIVPDLPLEEGEDFRAALDAQGLALIQLVTPATPDDRMARLCAASKGFVYAVTIRGITGGTSELPAAVPAYLDRIKAQVEIPVCAGFGVRRSEQVRDLGRHADGVIVGSALVEQLEAGNDPVEFLKLLRS